MPKFAANLTMMFNEVSFLERFALAAQAGFRYVEYLWPYAYSIEQLRDKLESYGLKQVLFNTPAGNIKAGEWGLAALPGREAEARQQIDLALEYALGLGCPQVHIMAGVVPEGEDRANYQQTFIENLRYASDKFKPYGIKLLVEALSPAVKPHYLLKSQWDSLAIVEQAKRDNLFVQLDYFHAQNVDGNLSRLTEQLKGKFAHIQIASVPYRTEPDEGEINYQHLFDLLDAMGYEGYIGCEYKPRGNTEQGLAWFNAYR